MAAVQFGLVVPGDSLAKAQRRRYVEDVNRLLTAVKGAYASAWFIDHLQFQDSDVLEGWTALTYFAALHPELQWGHSVLCQSFRNPAHLARHADWWNVSSTGSAEYRSYVREFERACDEVGRDPATARRSWGGGCVYAPTEREVAKILAQRPTLQPGEDLIGIPRQLVEQMQPFVELGVDYFMLDCSSFPDLTTVTMLVNEVLPALNRQ
jgi:alkanesulfonate monooxygenase SsuD/methylene tetrahydromethanopterin reductase-like flavin-dependent oxidoreductase (luciferase family)